ncbi:MAG: hypothetical protein R3Y24_02535 [Eubacteriales bacterium]
MLQNILFKSENNCSSSASVLSPLQASEITELKNEKKPMIHNLLLYCKENKWFVCLFLFMVIYYGIHLFTLTPWYDELYTYYSFISRGPIYAAIHWPVPNNHVFYSVISALFDWTGNAYIGLRGFSYVCALANMILLYQLAKKFFNNYLSFACVCLYIAVIIVNTLAIQGRGYTFTMTCYFTAILMLYNICIEHHKPTIQDTKINITGNKSHRTTFSIKTLLHNIPLYRHYIIFSISLTLGLYTISSSLYWVLSICFVGGFYLLFQKNTKKLIQLIVSAIIAALNTLILYAVIWLAIGSNLVSKDAQSIYYGVFQLKIIIKAPFLALQTGMQYMLDTPYIQSIERKDMLNQLFGWCHLLFDQFYSGFGKYITILLIISIPLLLYYLLCSYNIMPCSFMKTKGISSSSKQTPTTDFDYSSSRKETITPDFNKNKKQFLLLYLLVTLCMFPLILIIQSVLPYQRVFIYIGGFIALLFIYYIGNIFSSYPKLQIGCVILIACFTISHLLSPDQNTSYGLQEEEIYEVFSEIDMNSINSIFYTDDYQKYVLKFYWDLELTEVSLEEADCILVSKEILDNKDQEIPNWPILYTYNQLPFDDFAIYFPNFMETDSHILYYR